MLVRPKITSTIMAEIHSYIQLSRVHNNYKISLSKATIDTPKISYSLE